MNFGSKWVLAEESDEESLSDEDMVYSDSEDMESASINDNKNKKQEKMSEEDKKKIKTKKVRKADTNVMAVSMETLASPAQLLTGDPIFCSHCSAAFNHLSKITSPKSESSSSGESDSLWICEFCSQSNPIHIEEEEKPTAESGDYIIGVEEKKGSSSTQNSSLVIFCIDISGSMCVTTEVAGVHKLKGNEQLSQIRKGLGHRDSRNQYLPNEKKNTTYISRLQCVQAAVEQYMTKIKSEAPESVIGLVTFNGEVTVIGDGTKTPITVAGDKLSNYKSLLKTGKKIKIENPISKSYEALNKHLFKIEESGPTALGPALLVSLGIASHQRGTRVIICTDGMANVGLGAQDVLKTEAEKVAVRGFYEEIGKLAGDTGVSVSVISIKGTEANMENLGKIAEFSGGQVNIVDPLSLHEEFASILSEKVIATNVVVDLFLHQGLHLRNDNDEQEEEKEVQASKKKIVKVKSPKKVKERKAKSGSQEKKGKKKVEEKPVVEEAAKSPATENDATTTATASTSTTTASTATTQEAQSIKSKASRKLRNVTKDTQITFEFGRNKEFQVPPELTELPFQVQIRFVTLEGKECIRTISRALPITQDRKKAEEAADFEVLANNTTQLAAKLAFKGEYTESRTTAFAHKKLLKRIATNNNSNNNSNSNDMEQRQGYTQMKTVLSSMNKKLETAQKKEREMGLDLSDDEEDSDNEAQGEGNEKRDRPRTRNASSSGEKKKSNSVFSSFASKPAAKQATRQQTRTTEDETSTFLYQMKSPSRKPSSRK